MKKLIGVLILAATAALAQTPHGVSLAWQWSQGSGDPATGFHIFRGVGTSATACTITTSTPFATVSSPTTLTYTDSAVVGGGFYCYGLTVFNSAGDTVMIISSPAIIAVPLSVPNAPTGLTGAVIK